MFEEFLKRRFLSVIKTFTWILIILIRLYDFQITLAVLKTADRFDSDKKTMCLKIELVQP